MSMMVMMMVMMVSMMVTDVVPGESHEKGQKQTCWWAEWCGFENTRMQRCVFVDIMEEGDKGVGRGGNEKVKHVLQFGQREEGLYEK